MKQFKEADERMNKEDAQRLALAVVALCVRNTFLEDLHAGTIPSSRTGDYSDVKVVSPYGEIPWSNVSRISQDEMRQLMREIVNRVYSVLLHIDDPNFIARLNSLGGRRTRHWDEPNELKDFLSR